MPRGKANGGSGEAFNDQGAAPPKTNVSPAIIAQALAEMLGFDTRMASLAGLKGAAINRYEAQGVDRELLAALNKLGRKDPDEARAYIEGLTEYAVAAEVIRVADAEWTKSVRQSDMFTAAGGEAADELRRARAHKQGFQAGKQGHLLEGNPYGSKPGSPEFVGWRDGHGEGIGLRKIIKPGTENVTKAAGAPRPRGRPKKNQEAATEGTQLDKDTAAYRAKGTAGLDDPPPTETLQ